MPIHCVGFNYKSTNIKQREKLALSEEDVRRFIAQNTQPGTGQGWEEMVILSTCNRVEFYAITRSPVTPSLIQQIALFYDVPIDDLEAILYHFIDEQAAAHLFKVAAGLDSMVIGEPQILGQITRAYELAMEAGSARKTMSRLFRAAIHTGKRTRSETAIGEKSISISSLAARLASQKIQDLPAANIVLLGAGEMAEAAMEAFRKRGVKKVQVINRTLANACKLAERWHGEAATLEALPIALQSADVLITSTSAPHIVVHSDLIAGVMKARPDGSPLIIIDIAIPRDVSPDVASIPGVHHFDIDTLNDEVEQSLDTRVREIPKAEQIIFDELDIFLKYLATEKVIPLIIKMRNQADQIRQVELQKALKQMPNLDPETQEQLDRLTESLVNKILHLPTQCLRAESTGPDCDTYTEIAQSLFGLKTTEK